MRTLTKIAPSAKPNRRSFASSLIMLNPHHYCFSLETKASAAIVLLGAPHWCRTFQCDPLQRPLRSKFIQERSRGTFVPQIENKFRKLSARASEEPFTVGKTGVTRDKCPIPDIIDPGQCNSATTFVAFLQNLRVSRQIIPEPRRGLMTWLQAFAPQYGLASDHHV